MLFREWLHRQKVIVKDWPYASTDFRRDPNMLLPTGKQWDEGGKHLIQTPHYLRFDFYDVFGIYHAYVLIMSLMLLVDVGSERLVGLAPETRRDP